MASASAPAAANDGEQPQKKMRLAGTEDEVTENEVTKAAAAAGGTKARTGAKSTAAWARDVKDDEAAAASSPAVAALASTAAWARAAHEKTFALS